MQRQEQATEDASKSPTTRKKIRNKKKPISSKGEDEICRRTTSKWLRDGDEFCIENNSVEDVKYDMNDPDEMAMGG